MNCRKHTFPQASQRVDVCAASLESEVFNSRLLAQLRNAFTKLESRGGKIPDQHGRHFQRDDFDQRDHMGYRHQAITLHPMILNTCLPRSFDIEDISELSESFGWVDILTKALKCGRGRPQFLTATLRKRCEVDPDL